MEITAAILLRKTRFSDTSLIISWCTETHGKIKTMAKGARRPKSPFAGKLDLFFEVELQFVRSKKSDLHILKEVVLRHPHGGLRENFQSVALASYFVELIEMVTEPEHAAPELFALLQRALRHLNEKPPTKRALVHFESELCRLLGIHGEAATTPSAAIARTYHRLPTARAALHAQLP